MKEANLKNMCYVSGCSFSEVHSAYLQALQEAKSLGVEEDESKVMSILETILEIDSADTNSKKVTSKYLESGKDFSSFLEELVSSSIPQSSRPEPDIDIPFEVKEEEEIEDGPYNHKLHGSEKEDAGIEDDNDLEHY